MLGTEQARRSHPALSRKLGSVMKVIRFNLQILGPVICLLTGGVFAKALPLPDNLIGLTSQQGEHLLLGSKAQYGDQVGLSQSNQTQSLSIPGIGG
jgi:hypothetical protein